MTTKNYESFKNDGMITLPLKDYNNLLDKANSKVMTLDEAYVKTLEQRVIELERNKTTGTVSTYKRGKMPKPKTCKRCLKQYLGKHKCECNCGINQEWCPVHKLNEPEYLKVIREGRA